MLRFPMPGLVSLVLILQVGLAGTLIATDEAYEHQGYPGDECVSGPDPLSGAAEYETVDLGAVLSSIEAGQPVTLPFYQRDYPILFSRWTDLVVPGAEFSYVDENGVHIESLSSMVYAGVLVQNTSNSVVFGITSNWIHGFLADNDGIYVLEMSRDPQSPTPHRSYRLDISQHPGCGGEGDSALSGDELP